MSCCRLHLGTLLTVFVAVLLTAIVTLADVGQPVQVQIKEREPGAYLVQWRAPKTLPLPAIPSPVLPAGCRAEGERVFLDQPNGWLSRQVYRCSQGLAGQTIGIKFPLYNPSLTTVFRVELLSGERFAHALSPREESWRIPETSIGALASWLKNVRTTVLRGTRHVLDHPVHLIFLLALILLGGITGSMRLVTAFGGGQVVAISLVAIIGSRIATFPLSQVFPHLVADICVALAVLFLAREALRPVTDPHRLAALAAGAGLFHGLTLATLLGTALASAGVAWIDLVVLVLGMDATLLILALGTGGLIRIAGGHRRTTRFRHAVTYLVGGSAVAAILVLAFSQPATEAARAVSPRLPVMSASTTAGLPGSRRVAPQAVTAPIQSYLTVEPFEVRHEVLISLSQIATAIDLEVSENGQVEIASQAEVIRQLTNLVTAGTAVVVDAQPVPGIVDRASFMTASVTGVLPRQEPVREALADALVGVTIVSLIEGVPDALTLDWDEEIFTVVAAIPATVIDPESSYATTLTREQPLLRWENNLLEDPVPSVSSVAVVPPRLPVPLISLGLVLGAGAVFLAGLRRRQSTPATRTTFFAAGRITLALALLVVPLVQVAVALPSPLRAGVSSGQARQILAGVLPNVYRAFEFREETAVYDRLAVSVMGETLTQVYLEHRQALEMAERGGARARVDAVEVLDVRNIQSRDDGGFEAEASWTVGGNVTHFGHRHFRQNRYDTRVAVVPDSGMWKIRSIEVRDQERVR